MSSNGALLNERTAHALLDAGLHQIKVNVTEIDETYERIYKLPFARTRENILRFKELAQDTCEVIIVLVDHRDDPEHLKKMRQYWRDHGITRFQTFGLINRGGALAVEHMRYETYPEVAAARTLLKNAGVDPICAAPFVYLFVGYDGQYYLDGSDWTKKVPLGSVFDVSFIEIMAAKLDHVRSREPVCKSCSNDPTNRLSETLRRTSGSADAHEVRDEIERIRRNSALMRDHIDAFSRAAGVTPRGTKP
jgi:MoaA/NifB/PqqE/SkfB family radical SAM enzyme